jgi:D-alanyl-D-alanine carboxypeptidase/D-alanyl-D-alanine-endopeptidase (penicillin-binding protein 4)
VKASVAAGAAGSQLDLDLEPELPGCIGTAGCTGHVSGSVPAGFVPPLTGKYPLVRTFRIVQPANYARTVFIEALKVAGVAVDAPVTAPNPVARLPGRADYPASAQVAQLVSHPYRDYVRHILKVSYNIGADTSLVLFGVANGTRTLAGALGAEQQTLAADFGIAADQLHFIDGSGGGETTATNQATIGLLEGMSRRAVFPVYLDALPRLGVDGSLSFVTDFARDPALAGARGQVRAKTGTFVQGTAQGPVLRTQALAGYIVAKSGRRLAFTLAVNDVGVVAGLADVMAVFQDEGTIAAMLWRAY